MEFTKEVVKDLIENESGVLFNTDYSGDVVYYMIRPVTLQRILQHTYDQGFSKGLIEDLGNDV